MSTRRKCIAIAAVMLLFGVMLAGYGCKKTESEVQAADSIALCIKCGQIKGTDVCCKPGQTTCDKCGLVKGAPGCCKLPAK